MFAGMCTAAHTDNKVPPTPSPLELAISRVQARKTLRSFAMIVGVLHFGALSRRLTAAPYLFHFVGNLCRK